MDSSLGPLPVMRVIDQRRLQHAEGYLELELAPSALAELQLVHPQVRLSFPWKMLMAEALRMQQEHEASIAYFEDALRLNPDAMAAYIGLGWCFKRTNQLPKAIDALRTAEKRCRNGHEEYHALVMYNLSCYYSLAGRKYEMLLWLGRALKLDASFRKSVESESDFDSFRNDPEFIQLVHGPTAPAIS